MLFGMSHRCLGLLDKGLCYDRQKCPRVVLLLLLEMCVLVWQTSTSATVANFVVSHGIFHDKLLRLISELCCDLIGWNCVFCVISDLINILCGCLCLCTLECVDRYGIVRACICIFQLQYVSEIGVQVHIYWHRRNRKENRLLGNCERAQGTVSHWIH